MKSFLKNLTPPFQIFGITILVLLIIIPFPAIIIDIFIGINLFFSILIFINIIKTQKNKKIAFLPTFLLLHTIFSIAIAVSITRPILLKGAKFDGLIIRIISNFIAGSGDTLQLYFGFVIFLFFVAITTLIVCKGIVRVAEVAARWTLDSLPGKMMAIDTEYSSGAITEEKVQKRKTEIQDESDYIGAIDGVSKFISGNIKTIREDYIALKAHKVRFAWFTLLCKCFAAFCAYTFLSKKDRSTPNLS